MTAEIRHNWTKEEILSIYNKPLMELLYEAATIHRLHHDPNTVQVSTLLIRKFINEKSGFMVAIKVLDANKVPIDVPTPLAKKFTNG